MTTFAYRVIGAVRLDSRIYEEVEADRQATLQAVVVVLTASAAGGIAQFGTEQPSMPQTPASSRQPVRSSSVDLMRSCTG